MQTPSKSAWETPQGEVILKYLRRMSIPTVATPSVPNLSLPQRLDIPSHTRTRSYVGNAVVFSSTEQFKATPDDTNKGKEMADNLSKKEEGEVTPSVTTQEEPEPDSAIDLTRQFNGHSSVESPTVEASTVEKSIKIESKVTTDPPMISTKSVLTNIKMKHQKSLGHLLEKHIVHTSYNAPSSNPEFENLDKWLHITGYYDIEHRKKVLRLNETINTLDRQASDIDDDELIFIVEQDCDDLANPTSTTTDHISPTKPKDNTISNKKTEKRPPDEDLDKEIEKSRRLRSPSRNRRVICFARTKTSEKL
jgi:hypothetical protein